MTQTKPGALRALERYTIAFDDYKAAVQRTQRASGVVIIVQGITILVLVLLVILVK